MRVRIAAAIAAVVGAAACSSPARRPAAAPTATVDAPLHRVEAVDIASSFEAGGVVRARLTATIASRLLAPVTEVRVQAGDRVRRGQTLIVLDGRELAAQAVRARASVDAARETSVAASAAVDAAQANAALTRASYDRVDGLHARRSATAQELDEARAALKSAEANLAGAEAQKRAAASAALAAEAAANAADVAGSYSAITAPFDGIVAERTIDPGSIAAPGLALLTIEDPSAFRLEVRLDEARAAAVRTGAPAEVRLDEAAAGTDGWTPARVAEIARIDPLAHGFVVKLDLPAGAAARSGLFGRARFAGAPRRALAVPESAVLRRGQLSFVFAAVDGFARLRAVTTGQASNGQVEILAGLVAGEQIVAAPAPAITDGMRLGALAAATRDSAKEAGR